jgi:photosystem II stability/assembly factor-like uncharacterized protein
MNILSRLRLFSMVALVSLVLAPTVHAATDFADSLLEDGYQFREIGPFRGGRSGAVAGVSGDPMTWYFGATGGGVFKSQDAGQSWKSVSDGFFGGSIGAIAVSEADPNVIYVGGGEQTVRGNVSHGYGMFKSLDAGKTWKSIGLVDSRHIGRIRVHPKDPDLVYVAAMGHLFGPNQERGLYRSLDGGVSWERVLFVDENTGCVDVAMDPSNPRVLYANFWQLRRAPHRLDSGGAGSSMFMSTDGGESWTPLKDRPGMPAGVWGNNALTVSPQDPERLWAVIEAEEGGVFRSDDQGETWQKLNDERKLRQRAWYYTRIYADTQDVDTVYVLNVRFWKSKDGGKSFESIRTPHGDHHDLWIDPHDARHFVVGDDGGAQVTFDGGENFTTYHNQATAQFYRVTTDDHFPYRIYGAQQDNSTVRIVHRSDGGRITDRDWESTAGGESGWIAPDPRDNDIVYGGSYDGFLTRINHRNGEVRGVNVWPDNPMGHGAEGMKERFQWNFPILFSRHEPGLLYAAGNRLFTTRDEGASWQAISEDLTRNDPEKLKSSGGPITQDNTGVEYYCTIFALAEDVFEAGVIWTGSDDGLVHLTRDGGESWLDVTPKGLPEWIQINSIEADPHHVGGAYVAATNYKNDDFAPYLYRTQDYGRSWKKIVRGIDPLHFSRVLRADPHREGMLFAGTESGLYLSFDDGAHWSAFQLNLPIVPITDLAIKENDLVVATQGRSFWVLDDLTLLQQWSDELAAAEMHLFAPRSTWRMSGRGQGSSNPHAGTNLPSGAMIFYRFDQEPDSSAVKVEILDQGDEVVRSYSPKAEEEADQMTMARGLNRVVWNLEYPPAEEFEGMILWWARTAGPRALPGRYKVRLTVGEHSQTVDFELRQDPRSSATAQDLQQQFDFLLAVRDRLTEVHEAIEEMRQLRAQLEQAQKRMGDDQEELKASAEGLLDRIETIETALYQTKNRSPQDPLNFPVRLNNKLGHLAAVVGMGDNAPTAQAFAVKGELEEAIAEQMRAWLQLRDHDIADFNALAAGAELPALRLGGKMPPAPFTPR